MQPSSARSTWPFKPGLKSLSATWYRSHLSPFSRSGRFLCTFVLTELLFGLQLLAGAKINELTKHRQTALHLAAQQDLATICSVLLENGVDFAAEDENGNNGKGGRAARGGSEDAASSLSLLLSQLCIWP